MFRLRGVIAVFFVLFLLIFLPIIVSAQMNSTNYAVKSGITSDGGSSSNSSKFIMKFIMGIISGNIVSSTYNNFVGFFSGASVSCDIYQNSTLSGNLNCVNLTIARGVTLDMNGYDINISQYGNIWGILKIAPYSIVNFTGGVGFFENSETDEGECFLSIEFEEVSGNKVVGDFDDKNIIFAATVIHRLFGASARVVMNVGYNP